METGAFFCGRKRFETQPQPLKQDCPEQSIPSFRPSCANRILSALRLLSARWTHPAEQLRLGFSTGFSRNSSPADHRSRWTQTGAKAYTSARLWECPRGAETTQTGLLFCCHIRLNSHAGNSVLPPHPPCAINIPGALRLPPIRVTHFAGLLELHCFTGFSGNGSASDH